MNTFKCKKLSTLLFSFLIIVSPFNFSIINSRAKPQDIDIAFDTKIKVILKIMNIPSMVICLIKNNTVVFIKPYGYKNLYKREKAGNNTIYCLGSVSKAITAIALMQLHEKGFFNLDDDITNYLGFEIRNPRYPDINITFRMLLSHQASFNDFGLKIRKLPYMLVQARLLKNQEQLIKEMLLPNGKAYSKRFFARYEPGEKAMYDEISYILAGQLVEKISGLPLEDYCKEYIFNPLDMKDTSFNPNKLDKSRIAQPYVSLFKISSPLPKYDFLFLDAAAGVWSTAEDLSHLLIALLNNGTYNGSRILKKETIDLMHTKHYPQSYDVLLSSFFGGKVKIQHGLGWLFIEGFGMKLEGHAGGPPGYNCHFYLTKIEKNETIGIIALGNGPLLFPAFAYGRLVAKWYESILKLLIEKVNEL